MEVGVEDEMASTVPPNSRASSMARFNPPRDLAEPSTATTMCSKGLRSEVLDDQGVRLRQAPHHALGYGAEHRVLDGGHPHRADDDQVVVAGVHVLDDDLEVLAFEGAA